MLPVSAVIAVLGATRGKSSHNSASDTVRPRQHYAAHKK